MIGRREFVAATAAVGVSLAQRNEEWGVLIYGATPAGIAAAWAAADDGERVLLVEPTARIGGLVTCGLSHTDFRTFEGLSGAHYDFTRRVLAHYEKAYGKDSQQARDSWRGTQAEPKVNLAVFEAMLAERRGVRVVTGHVLREVKREGRRVAAVVLEAGGKKAEFRAGQFIDASYEGDLMAAAGVPYRVGREGRAEYGESLAPEVGDGQLQAYNFRFAATKVAANRVTVEKPAGYRREEFEGVLPLLADGRIKSVFGYPSACIFKAQIPMLPNGKYDINDVSLSAVRLSLPGENLEWPEGDEAARRRVFERHVRWNVGLLYFLQNDAAVPEKFRNEARQYGWCRDEFVESGHLPPQLYVREARRMTGLHVYTERDTEQAAGDARAKLHRDAVAIGDYSHNCHGTSHEGPMFGGKHVGEFYKAVMPYQAPYGTLAPKEVENLLVAGAVSSSHVGFCALRLEPIWMALGQAAGHAAAQARRGRVAVQKVNVAALQERLHKARAATMYVSDVGPEHGLFRAVQWWGLQGGLHGLEPAPEKPGQRGPNIEGQYFRAYPGHAVQLEKELDGETERRWRELARAVGVKTAPKGRRRGEWIEAAWRGRSRG